MRHARVMAWRVETGSEDDEKSCDDNLAKN